MLLTLLQFFATKFLFLALHLEAGSFPRPLSPQEEIRTFAALRAGDPSAREKLIRHNLRLVAHIAKKYYALPSEPVSYTHLTVSAGSVMRSNSFALLLMIVLPRLVGASNRTVPWAALGMILP